MGNEFVSNMTLHKTKTKRNQPTESLKCLTDYSYPSCSTWKMPPGMYVVWQCFHKNTMSKGSSIGFNWMAGRTKRQDFILSSCSSSRKHWYWLLIINKWRTCQACQWAISIAKSEVQFWQTMPQKIRLSTVKTTDLGLRRSRRIPWACGRLSPLTWMQRLKGHGLKVWFPSLDPPSLAKDFLFILFDLGYLRPPGVFIIFVQHRSHWCFKS